LGNNLGSGDYERGLFILWQCLYSLRNAQIS
jgi:hypothetical protein